MRWKKANQNKKRVFAGRQLPELDFNIFNLSLRPKTTVSYPNIVVSLCCRDGQGNFEEKVYKIHVGEIEIDCDFMEGVDLLYLDQDQQKHWFPSGYIKIQDRILPVLGCREYYGNLCWDGVEMKPEVVIEIINYLMSEGFGCEAAPTEIFDMWDKKEPLSAKHIPLLLDVEGGTDWDYYHFMR
jgi:hypothetical protein